MRSRKWEENAVVAYVVGNDDNDNNNSNSNNNDNDNDINSKRSCWEKI